MILPIRPPLPNVSAEEASNDGHTRRRGGAARPSAVGLFHRRVLRLVGMGMFFDSFDNSMMAGVLAALVGSGMSTLALNATFISATFLGLTVGAATAGLLGDRLGAASPISSIC